jgi:GDPmannose 4,6-dehydratase
MLYKKRALIFGISGQDGSYLAKLLLKKKYKVFGTVRKVRKLINFKILSLKNIKIFKVNIKNYNRVKEIIKYSRCSEIYYLSGVSSVQYSNFHALKTLEDNTKGFFNICEACRKLGIKVKIYNALSSECFGNKKKKRINEKTLFDPLSPYALSKTVNYYLANHFKNNFNLYISNGFSFNHDSILRPNNYLLKKIINFCKNKKKNIKLELGNINVSRDWGWAPEHVKFIYKILKLKSAHNFIIGTGKTTRLKKLISIVFRRYKLNTNDNIKINKNFIRLNDIKENYSNPAKLKSFFGSVPSTKVENILDKLIKNEIY